MFWEKKMSQTALLFNKDVYIFLNTRLILILPELSVHKSPSAQKQLKK